MKLLELSSTYTDLYQLTMGQVYYQSKKAGSQAVFDYFFRKLPYEGGFVVFAGLEDLLEQLQTFQFTDEDLGFLKSTGLDDNYVNYLKDFRFKGSIHSVREGEVVFPYEPVLRVEANMIEAQIIETLLLNILNFQSLVATKAARVRIAAGSEKILSDFGLRRAHALGGYSASRAAYIGGFDSTSNVLTGRHYDIPVSGTMAHSFIQSYDDELTAFRDYAKSRPDDTILLVDTYNTLKSGVPNAIKVAKEMKNNGHLLKAIRLDSGDLAYLAKQSRKMLDDAGLGDVKIAASNQLDEQVIKSLKDQKAPIDIFGVGTSLVTGSPDAALDGVYKLSSINGEPKIKLSENIRKTTLPGKKQVWRMYDKDGNFFGADAVSLGTEKLFDTMHHPYDVSKSMKVDGMEKEPLLQTVMLKGEVQTTYTGTKQAQKFAVGRLGLLPEEYKRFQYPHTYKVGITSELKGLRNKLRDGHKV